MANYPTQVTIELVHGASNVRIWADLDNNKNSTIIASRVNWSAEVATEYVNGRLIMNRYTLPFSAVPKMVTHISSLLAGILLHDGRNNQSENMRDNVSPKRKEFKRLLREILSGQLKLTHPTTGEIIESACKTTPFNITADTDLYVNRSNCYYVPGSGFCNVISAWCSTCCCHTCLCKSLYLPCW